MKCIVCGNDIPGAVKNCPVCGAAAPSANTSYGGYGSAPVNGQPVPEKPVPMQPQYGGPSYDQPFYGQPAFGQPVPQQPVFEENQAGLQKPVYKAPEKYDPYAGIKPSESGNGSAAQEAGDKAGGRKGLIAGIIAGAAVVIALIVCFAMGLFHFKNGTYIWDDYEFDGTSLTLEISGDEGTLTAKYRGKTDTEKVHLDFDGSKVVFSANGKYIEGTYDRKAQTISVPDDSLQGFDIVLKKK